MSLLEVIKDIWIIAIDALMVSKGKNMHSLSLTNH
jgi:hypothetical protein